METSDDKLFGGGSGVDIPKSRAAENTKRTATPVGQSSDADRRNRRRRAVGAGTALRQPRLSTPGLLGIPNAGI